MMATGMTPDDLDTFGNQQPCSHRGRVVLLLSLFILLLIGAVSELLDGGMTRGILWKIYTPPALSEERVATYCEFIRLVQKHPELSRVSLTPWGALQADRRFDPTMHDGAQQGPATASFSATEQSAMKDISAELRKINGTSAVMVERANGYRVFRFSRYPGSASGHFMNPPAVYVVNPRDPNDVDAIRQATGYGDLEHIKGCWYASRSFNASRLYPRGLRIPKSIFDHSLDVPRNFESESTALKSGDTIPIK
jgi:hypothetical protein